jgi:SAM-dependent methyltransferase
MSYRELLVGCGNRRQKFVRHGDIDKDWQNLTTLDIDEAAKPDVVHDLNVLPYPFADSSFDEIHAYHVLEHFGTQGDWRAFFAQFTEFWRILKPGGLFVAIVPMWDSEWAWGDPGHTRVITKGTLAFLSQQCYADEIGSTTMTDYRSAYSADFQPVAMNETEHDFGFILKAIKE